VTWPKLGPEGNTWLVILLIYLFSRKAACFRATTQSSGAATHAVGAIVATAGAFFNIGVGRLPHRVVWRTGESSLRAIADRIVAFVIFGNFPCAFIS
jgi:hypothetical protein